jgi:hypothetical protein
MTVEVDVAGAVVAVTGCAQLARGKTQTAADSAAVAAASLVPISLAFVPRFTRPSAPET